MGALEISLLTLMVLVVLAGFVRLAGLRRTHEQMAARDQAIAALEAKIAEEVAEANHWRAKTEEAKEVLAAVEAKVEAGLMAAVQAEARVAQVSAAGGEDRATGASAGPFLQRPPAR